MLFNSVHFAVFLPVVVALFFLTPHRYRWVLLLGASYYFYMCWRAEYLVLILISTAVDYVVGRWLGTAPHPGLRKALLAVSLVTNLGLLFAFKYANFVSDSLRMALEQVNVFRETPYFDVLLPVGISFYTFQTLSYTIDVYRGTRRPERHPGIFAVYVAFFPQLVAGPIERSQHLLPQFHEYHPLSYSAIYDGIRLMLWGFFMKIVVADRLALYVDQVFDYPAAFGGAPTAVAAVFFSFQIYCDFSGYSYIAIGSAQCMGFRLMDNFRRPYFAQTIAEFWHRWHISLSTWFRDYLYIPMGGNRVEALRWCANLMIVFTISGLWHGANWTFIIWGALHGLYYLLSRLTERMRKGAVSMLSLDRIPRTLALGRMAFTFVGVTLAFVFFRANSLGDAVTLFSNFVTFQPLEETIRVALRPADFAVAWAAIAAIIAVEWYWEWHPPTRGRAPLADARSTSRWLFDYGLLMGILVFGEFGYNPFIYFQF